MIWKKGCVYGLKIKDWNQIEMNWHWNIFQIWNRLAGQQITLILFDFIHLNNSHLVFQIWPFSTFIYHMLYIIFKISEKRHTLLIVCALWKQIYPAGLIQSFRYSKYRFLLINVSFKIAFDRSPSAYLFKPTRLNLLFNPLQSRLSFSEEPKTKSFMFFH